MSKLVLKHEEVQIFLHDFLIKNSVPSGQNLTDSAGNPRRRWWLVEGIHAETWVVSETRSNVEIQG